MYMGFINVHPITLPLGNEMMHALGSLFNHAVMVYTTTIEPDLIKLIKVIDML